jgi:hypothetical protein
VRVPLGGGGGDGGGGGRWAQGENEGGFGMSGLYGVSPSEFAQSRWVGLVAGRYAALRLQD